MTKNFQSISSKKEIEKIEKIMQTYGLDGEDAFFTIASFYISSYVKILTEKLNKMHSLGLDIRKKYKISKYHCEEINHVIKRDTSGDLLPIFYQHFLSKRFRGISGKFFTPHPIAEAMVGLLTPFNNAIIMDPTCGSGTFLKEASRKWEKLNCQLVGNDSDPLLIDLTELSLSIELPKNHSYRLFNTNIYEHTEEIRNLYQKADYVIANPPFSLPINHFNGESRLFDLGFRNSDAIFLDIAFNLLKPSGRLVCLLPHSIISNVDFMNLRIAIEKYWYLLGVISLPEGIFYTTAGTSTRADILILEKAGKKERPEKTFLCHVSSVGVPLKTHVKETENQLMELISAADIQELLEGRLSE